MHTPTRESRLPELRLPEISREGIARGLSEIHAPDLSKIERPNIEMPDIDLSRIDFPRIDIAKAVVGAASAVGLVRPRRSRWPFVLGAGIIVGLTGWALMNLTAIRERLDRAALRARGLIDEMRAEREGMDPVAFTAAATAPIDPGPYVEAESAANDYPEGLGAATDKTDAAGDGIPAFEEAGARA